MKTTIKALALISSCLVAGAAHGQTVFAPVLPSTDLNDSANWDNGSPTPTNPGTVNVDASNNGNQNQTWAGSGSTVTFGGGMTWTAAQDASMPSVNLIVNDATINAADDILTQSGSITLNAGSSVTTGDLFYNNQANGSITINGGTHVVGTQFGNNNGSSSVTITGGQVTAEDYILTGGTFTLDGSGTLLSEDATTDVLSTFTSTATIEETWTGIWEVGSFTGTDWRDLLTGGNANISWFFGATAIDGTVFDDNFSVSGGGTTLSVIPEPSSLALLGVGFGLMWVMNRRRS